MKYSTLLIILLAISTICFGQDVDITLSAPESGTKLHQARNSITFAPNYSYTPNGGTMTAEIVNPLVIPEITGDIVFNNAIDPSSYSINTSLDVGKTPGSLNVSGSVRYAIPLDVPKGIGGMQPAISLNYVSSFMDGPLGIGWNISGLSAITRVNKTFYHDNKSDAIRGDLTDRYALDGNRLIKISGTYGHANSEYRTEMEQFSKIVAYGSTGHGPEWFKVYTKSGLIYEYGRSDNSKIKKYNGCILSWKLNKIYDRYDNYITFIYLDTDDEHPIGFIEYTGNSSQSQIPFASLVFNYKKRSDISYYCYGGKEFRRDILLDNIEIKKDGQIYKKYEMNYMQDTHAQLIKVTEKTSSASFNPTVFAWTDQTEQFTQTTHYTNSSNEIYFQGDFNGDGRTDFVAVPVKSTYTSNDKWKMYLANSNGIMEFETQGNLNSNFETFIEGDFNGDGLSDLMMQQKYYPTSTYPNRKRYYLYESTGVNFTRSSSSYICYNNERLDIVDYNGDGKLEFMFHNTNNNWYLYTYSGQSIYSASIPSFGEYYVIYYVIDNGMQNRILDFNGDGCSDLLVLFNNSYKIYEFKGANNKLIETHSGYNIENNDFLLFGDYNGDGTTDIIKEGNTSGADWSMLHLTANGFAEHDLSCFDNFSINISNNRIYAREMNGDGKTDVVLVGKGDNTNNSYNRINVALSTGSDFNITEKISSVTMNSWYDKNFNFGDYNGDGRYQLFYKYYGTSKLYSFATGTPSHLISDIIDGFGARTEITYLPMSNSTVYTRGTGATYPLIDFSSAMQLVYRVDADNGIGGTASMTYKYEGAKIHRKGKGFLGFTKITATNEETDIVTESNYDYDTGYFYPQLKSVYTKNGSGTISTVTNTWNEKDFGNKRIFPYIETTTQTDNLKGHTVTTTIAYDDDGNITSTEKDYGGGVKETTTNTYIHDDSSNPLLSKLDSSTVKYEKTGEAAISRTVSYTYSSDGIIKPDLIKHLEGTALSYTVDNDYDSYGNLIKKKESGSGVADRETSYTYYPDGINLKTITDPLGHVTEMFYDQYGRMTSKKDFLNNTTSYTYDGFGRVLTETRPDGYVAGTSYHWGLTGGPAHAVYYVQKTGNDGSLSKTWHDKLDREIRNDIKGFDGSYIYTATEYNAKGQLYRVSEPGLSTTPSQWTVHTYDSYGRVIGIARPTGRNTTYTYSSNKVTETTAGKTSWKETDSRGLVTAAHDNGGDISYKYYPDGKPKTITAPGNAVTSMEYDIAGNQTKLTDPSAGTITYTYDAYGQLLTQKNGRNQTTTFDYLPDGRLNTKTTPEGTFTYNYNSNKQLTGITSTGSGNVGRSYAYDNLGRVNSITETIANLPFSTTFTYDDKGRLKTRTHPSGIVETNIYNGNGYLSSVKADNTTVWVVTAMNARQQVTAATYGTGLNATFGYNSYGYPESTKAEAGGTYKQDYRYSFDAVTGNLSSRQNYLKGLSESFNYDNLDRLTGVTGPENLSMTFEANGNILTKSDVGPEPFVYDNTAKPYALTKLNKTTGVIPSAAQSATYTSFEQVSTIDERDYHAAFTYNSDDQRCKMEISQQGSALLTRWYAGSRYIKETAGSTTKEFTWIGGDAYTAPVVAVKQGSSIQYFYLLRDYLGSITHVVDASYNVTAEYSFDAWGRRRDKDDWHYTLNGEPDLLAGRGFTSHEYLPYFNLYNMNGRLYDPLVGRFLSPDNYVQVPDFTQNFNRYSYALNNPLKFTDPDGENPLFAAMFIGGFFNFIFQGLTGHINSFGDALKAFGIGALSGLAGFGAGQAVTGALSTATTLGGAIANGAAIGAASGFAGGFVGGAGNAWAGGASFGQGLGIGLKAGGLGALAGGVIGGGINGIAYNKMSNFINSDLAYEYTFDIKTGAFNRVSDMGGENINFYHIGFSTDGGSAFRYFATKTIEGANAINVLRFWQSASSTISAFSIPAASLSGFFLEPAGPSTTTRNQDRRVPSGTYSLTPNLNSHPNDFMIYNNDVPASRGITIHSGNYPGDTEGCLLPGGSWSGGDAVWSSSDKLKQIRLYINNVGYKNVNLRIVNAFY